MAVLIALPVRLRVPGHAALLMGWGEKAGLLPWRSGWQFLGTSLDNLVEFPSIKPNTSALGAIVDLHPLSLTHREGDTTDGTWHTGSAAHRRASSFVGKMVRMDCQLSQRLAPSVLLRSDITAAGRCQRGPAREDDMGASRADFNPD